METIRNYLESMFKNLPQTDVVLKAKYELAQMMEDKYTELIKEGKTENEAVGVVIAEFGNLEELAKDLGIEDVYNTNKKINRRKVSREEIESYLEACKRKAIMISTGVALCISCVTGPIISDAFRINDVIGVVLMFVMLAMGVTLFIVSKGVMEDFRYLEYQPCAVEVTYLEEVKNQKREFMTTYSILMAVGVLLCVFCVMPAIVFSQIGSLVMEELSGAMLFWFVSVGVLLMIFSKKIKHSYEKVLSLNSENVFSEFGEYNGNKKDKISKIKSKNVRVVLSVFWPTITCIYLSISFITTSWHLSWLIWPIAGVIYNLIVNINSEE